MPSKERFLKPENRALVLARESMEELLRALEEWHAIHGESYMALGAEMQNGRTALPLIVPQVAKFSSYR